MEENMNEEALTADGQKDDDIDYVEDREELTEERIKDMLDAREYKELKEELETNMYPVDLAEILEEFDQKHMVLVFRLLAKEEAAETFSYMNSDMREDLINALTDSELEEIMEEMYLDDTVDVLEEMPANVVDRQTADGDRCGKTSADQSASSVSGGQCRKCDECRLYCTAKRDDGC